MTKVFYDKFTISNQKIDEFVLSPGGGIKADILKMGTIFNWEKEYFTMDQVRAIINSFENT